MGLMRSLGARQLLVGGHWALALSSGAMYGLAFCGYEQFYLAWVCLLPVLWALDDETINRLQAFALGWTTGTVAHLMCYTWIVSMLRDFGYLPLPLAILGYTLLCLAQASLFGAWGMLTQWLVSRRGVGMVWAAPLSMVLMEWLYPAIFPSYLANSQYRQLMVIQTLDFWGPLGVSFTLACTSSTLYQMLAWRFRTRRAFPLVALPVLVLLIAGSLLYGYGRIADLDDTLDHPDKTVTVGLVQANMGIFEKSENPEEGLRRHRDQSLEVESQGAQLVVWPESGYYYAIYEGTRNVKADVMGPLRTPVLFGGLRVAHGAHGREVFNTAFLAARDGTLLGSYDKTFLLMFGEYLPLGELLPFIYHLSPHTSHFTRGRDTVPLELDGVRYGALICYEDILPGFVRTVMQRQPDVLVNITNDAWFGRSREPLIHLALATFRAVEQRRFLLRATNSGISAIIDPTGRIVAQSPIFTRANVLGDVVPLQGITFYQHWGDWLGWLSGLVTLWWSRGAFARIRLPWQKEPPAPNEGDPDSDLTPPPKAPPAARKKKSKR